MSVLSTLALLITTAAVKVKPKRDEQIERLKGRVAQLEIALAIASIDFGKVERERDRQYEENVAQIAKYAALEAELRAWRERALVNIPAPQPAGPDYRPPELAQAQLQQLAQAQQNAYQQGGAALMQQQRLGSLLGAQNLQFSAELFCNCVPSRAQVWARGGGEA